MTFNESSEEIIIRHTPLKKWMWGGLLAVIFSFFFIWLVLLIVFKPQISFVFAPEIESNSFLFLLFASIGAAFVIFPAISAPQINITVNRKTKSVDILCRRIYGSKMERYFFYQIRKFKSHKGQTRFSPPYSLALIRANGKIIKLKIPTGDKNESTKIIKRLNKFIKQSPKDELAEFALSGQNSFS